MLYTIFQASEASISKEEEYFPNLKHLSEVVLKKRILKSFLCISLVQIQNPWGWANLDPEAFKKLDKGQQGCYIPSFKHLRQVFLKK